MSDPTPINTPAGYATATAIGFADPAGYYAPVSEAQPLPVTLNRSDAAPAALTGETSSSVMAGPFDAVKDRVVTISLDGTFQGTVTLQRSIDGGATRQGLRIAGQPWAVYSAPGTEQAWSESEDGATYYLDIALTSGTLAYRVSQ